MSKKIWGLAIIYEKEGFKLMVGYAHKIKMSSFK